MFVAGFYTYSIFALIFWETRRSDFGVSMGHHIATLILIVLSYVCRYMLPVTHSYSSMASFAPHCFDLLLLFIASLVLVRLFWHFTMQVMCFLKSGKCLSIVELKGLQAFHSFFLLCLGSFFASFTIPFGSYGAQGWCISDISL